MMRLSLRIADPAGNITIFVMTEVPAEQYASIAGKLLEMKQYQAEQVAFQVPPRMGAEGRIQMMGGEFCGNATRSFGYLLSCLSLKKPRRVRVEISGADKPLEVIIDHEHNCCETEMPLPLSVDQLIYDGEQFDAVCFDGIVHIIVPGGPKSTEFVEALLQAAMRQFSSDAYGVMFLQEDRLVPVVYVCGTRSLIWEGSCGSGSMACAVFRALETGQDGDFSFGFSQPGGLITATVSVSNSKITFCRMGGPVTLSEEVTIELEA